METTKKPLGWGHRLVVGFVGACLVSLAVAGEAAYIRSARTTGAEYQVKAIAASLPDASFREWEAYVAELTALGEWAAPALSELLDHEDRNTRTAAAHALGRIQYLEDEEAQVRAIAAFLGQSLSGS